MLQVSAFFALTNTWSAIIFHGTWFTGHDTKGLSPSHAGEGAETVSGGISLADRDRL